MVIPVQTAQELLRHMEWADALTWEAVLAGEAPRADETIRTYLLHLHAVQQVFLALWSDEPIDPVLKDVPQGVSDMSAVRDWARSYYPRAQRFLDAANEATFSRPLPLPWASQVERRLGQPAAVPTFSETAFQVVNHTTHHRGQVLARIRALGGEPPLVDYIAWVWFGKPAAAWNQPAEAAERV